MDGTENASNDRSRASRKLVSTTETIPDFLTAKFPMPDDIKMVHIIHKTTTLPHFQAKLPSGLSFEGKSLGLQVSCKLSRKRQECPHKLSTMQPRMSASASYNPDIDPQRLDRAANNVHLMSAKQRSMLQAWFMLHQWVSLALKHKKRRKQ